MTNYKENKQRLIELSNSIKSAKAMGGIDPELSINECLKVVYGIADKKLNTFNGWKKEGKQIIKGSKSFLFWSKPIKKNKDENEEKQEGGYKFFNVCYLFTNEQVQ